MSYRLFGAMAQ